MRTRVELRSSSFPADPDEDELINPGMFGRRLAAWVRSALQAAGHEAGEPFVEDWGWCVTIANPEFRTWVGCANLDETTDEFVVFVSPDRPKVRKGLRSVSTVETIERITAALDDALRAESTIHDVRWQ